MLEKQYLYAISVVAMKNQSVNNQLVSGLADKRHILADANAIVWQFDAAYSDAVVLISCNVSDAGPGGMGYQFTLKYTQGRLEQCVGDLVNKLEELLD
ncbi:hypothetical protein WCX18_04930 [Sulfurimonas sp. HSL1-2]|uniref:hypothetical protein n=1 Tax=Thiomicrolovo zhangzhouensis TaxID=3131933 RepID=UPI0031F9FD15